MPANYTAADHPVGDALPPRDHNRPPSVVELLTSELTETYALEFAKIEPIRERANAREQKIDSDEDLAAWTTIYVDANTLFKSLDAARLNEKRPLEAAIKDVFEPKQAPLSRITDWIKKEADDFNRKKIQKQRAEEAAERARLQKIAEDQRREAEIAAEFEQADQVVEFVKGGIAAQQAVDQAIADAAKASDVARVRTDSGSMSTAQAVWKFSIEDYSKVDLNSIRAFFTPAEIDKAVAKFVKLQKGATKIEGVKVFEDVGTSFRR